MDKTNLVILLKEIFKKHSKKTMMKIHRNEKWQNFSGEQCLSTIEKVSHSLIIEGVTKNEKVGIFSQNMPEWTLTDLGIMAVGGIVVPIYATNIAEQVKYILNNAEIQILFVGEKEQYNEVLACIEEGSVHLKRIIIFDTSVELKNDYSVYFNDWLQQPSSPDLEKEKELRIKSINEDDTATIIYTSGTTGKPKGVVLTHKNFIFQIKSHHARYHFTSEGSSLAFLPLSHVFERGWSFVILAAGMTNIYNKDPRKIADALLLVKPTAMCSVPRLYEKIYHLAIETMQKSTFVVKKLFFWALKIGRKRETFLQQGKKINGLLAFKDNIAEKLVYKKFREKLGGNLVFMPCGGAYLSEEVISFFRAMRLPLITGYGLSETTATVSSTLLNEYSLGSVGKPLENVLIKIGENNEILVKGDNVMKEYYKMPEETSNVFTTDGWFRTGDAGKMDDNGNLIITDRIKELIKTAGGKYIAPQLVESTLTNDPLIEQAIVYGESKPYAVALIAPNFEALKNWANEQKIYYNNLTNLVQNSTVVELFNKKIKELQGKLARYEQVKKIHILDKELSMKDGEMTPTLKPIKKTIFEKYKEFLEDLYKK